MTGRRRKLWGWGYEDQQPLARGGRAGRPRALASTSASAGRGRAAAARSRTSSCRRPALEPPAALAAICAADPLRRAPRTPTARPTATWCAPSAAGSTTRPTWSPVPRDERELEQRARLVRRGRRRGDPVRRRHQRGRRRRAALDGDYAGAVTIDLRPARPGARGRPGLARRAHPGRAPPGPRSRSSCKEHGLTLRHYPQSFEYSTLGRLDRHPRGRPLRHAAHPHRRPRRVGARAHPARRVGEPAAARLRRRAEPRPHADRLRGDPRRDHRGVGAGAGRARASRPRPRCCSTASSAGAEAVRALAQSRPLPVELPPARPRRGRAHRRGAGRQGAAGARLRVGRPPARRLDGAGARAVRRPRRRAAREARASPRAPGATPSSRRPTCATRWSPPASSPRPSRPRSPGTASTRSSPRCASAPRAALGPRGPRDLPPHARLPRRRRALLHGARPGAARLRARAVGRGQGGGVGGDRVGRRHDHPPPRRRPRPPPLVRPPAPRAVRRGAAGGQGARSTRSGMLNPGVLIDP